MSIDSDGGLVTCLQKSCLLGGVRRAKKLTPGACPGDFAIKILSPRISVLIWKLTSLGTSHIALDVASLRNFGN